MIVYNNSKVSFITVFLYLSRVLWVCSALVFLIFVIVLVRGLQARPTNPPKGKANYSFIGGGPLSLDRENLTGHLSLLSHQLSFFVKNSRPDQLQNDNNLVMALKGSGEEKVVHQEEKIFLADLNGRFLFSEEPTSLWVSPQLIDRSTVSIQVGIVREAGEMISHFVLDTFQKKKGGTSNENYLQFLSEAEWWGEDLLFQKYGGKEFGSFKDKQKIEIRQTSPYLVFVSEGDLLVWEDEKWKSTSREGLNPHLPIAQVKSIQNQQMVVEAWDASGGTPQQIQLPKKQLPSSPPKLEGLPTAFRYRSPEQVTCLFGKHRVILKQGDWVLKTTHGWRILKNLEDIESYLNHRIDGELFIFDNLEKRGNNYMVMGNLFNQARNQVASVSLPITKEKVRRSPKAKKKRALSKRDLVSSPSQMGEDNLG